MGDFRKEKKLGSRVDCTNAQTVHWCEIGRSEKGQGQNYQSRGSSGKEDEGGYMENMQGSTTEETKRDPPKEGK